MLAHACVGGGESGSEDSFKDAPDAMNPNSESLEQRIASGKKEKWRESDG